MDETARIIFRAHKRLEKKVADLVDIVIELLESDEIDQDRKDQLKIYVLNEFDGYIDKRP